LRQTPQLELADVCVFTSDVSGKTTIILVVNQKVQVGCG